MSDLDESDLASTIFGGDTAQASRVPEDLRPIILDRWASLRKMLDASRPNFQPAADKGDSDPIARTRELQSMVDDLKSKLASSNDENESLARQLEELHSSYGQARHKSVQLEESHDKLATENNELRRERDQLVANLEDVNAIAVKRSEELASSQLDCKRLSEQLAAANAAKYEAIVRTEDVEAKEISLRHREQRVESERELFEERLANLSDDLRAAHDDAAATRRELSGKLAILEGELASKAESVRILETREEALNADKEVLQSKHDDLIDRLKEARESQSSLEEGFRQEVRAQTRLAELHKQQCDDAEEKSTRLSEALVEVKGLLKEAVDRYGALEDNFDKEKEEHKEEIKRRNDAIRALRKELTCANELIDSLKQKGLTEEGIAQLSPAAAAASKLIKSGMSLTQVYSQLVAAEEELLASKDENRRLNTYLEQILTEIEQRAPGFKRERDEYERAVATVNKLTDQLEDLKESVRLDKDEADGLRNRLDVSTRDNERLSKQVRDNGHQIAVLLREVEAARFGQTTRGEGTAERLSEPADADDVVTGRLLTFHDAAELQQRNAELLVVIRELTAKQEAAEAQLVADKTAELRRELDDARGQLDMLTEARKRQEALVENIIVQRDNYKMLAEDQAMRVQSTSAQPHVAPGASTAVKSPQRSSASVAAAELRAAKAEAALDEIKKNFDVYRDEKCTHEKMLTEQLDSARTELSESRSKANKLASQEEWNTERFKLAQANNASYKKEIDILTDKNSNLNAIVAKHEQSIRVMHNEVVQSQSTVARTHGQLERARKDVENLRMAEARLEKERDMLNRQASGSALVAENLKMVQLQMEKFDSESRMRLQNQNEDLAKEVGLLQKKVATQQDSYHASVKAWETTQTELRAKLDSLKESEAGAKAAVEELAASAEELKRQLQISQEKLALFQADRSGEGRVDSEKVVDLQSQVNALKNELVSLKEHLAKARQATGQYKQLADSAEKQVVECNESAKRVKASYEGLAAEAKADKASLEARIAQLEAQKSDLLAQASEGIATQETGVARTERLSQEVVDLRDKLASAVACEREMKAALGEQVKAARQTQSRYEAELMAHADTTRTLTEAKDRLGNLEGKIVELEESKTGAEAVLKTVSEDAKASEATLRSEYLALKEQFSVVESENSALHEQMANLSTQMTSLHDSFGGGHNTSVSSLVDRSFSEEEAKSMGQLMEVIKYLRKEKAILTGKVEVSQAEAVRLKAHVESVQHKLAETQTVLAMAEEKANKELLPSAKYSQLMEKVQTIPALSDSNRMLREEARRLEDELAEARAKITETVAQVEPLREKLKVLEDNEEKVSAEMTALKADNVRWRQRVNQLIEKHQKISPEEVKKITTENSKLKTQVGQLQGQMKATSFNLANAQAKVKSLEDRLKAKEAEMAKASSEANAARQQATNRQAAAAKKAADLEAANRQLSAEKDALGQELERSKAASEANAKSQETHEESERKLNAELSHAKSELGKKDAQLEMAKGQITKLKALGRSLKEKADKFELESKAKEGENAKLLDDIKQLKETSLAASQAGSKAAETSVAASEGSEEKLSEAVQLIEQCQAKISELEAKLEAVGKEKAELEAEKARMAADIEKVTQKEQRAKNVLVTAKDKMTVLARENTELAAEKAEHEALVEGLQQEKERLQHDKDKLLQQVDQLLQQGSQIKAEKAEKAEAVTGKVKPVVSSQASAVLQQQARPKQEAHIQPTRHPVTVPQTATIRPTAMRSTAASLRQPSAATTSNVASVSPSSATGNLNPGAAEFVPRAVAAEPTAEASAEDLSNTPRALIIPRQSNEEPSAPDHGGPSGSALATSGPTAGPSGSSSGPSLLAPSTSMASVAPISKRRRDDEAGVEQIKKARTDAAASNESNTDDDEVEEIMEDEESGEVEIVSSDEDVNVDEDNARTEDDEDEDVEGDNEEDEDVESEADEQKEEEEEVVCLDSSDDEGDNEGAGEDENAAGDDNDPGFVIAEDDSQLVGQSDDVAAAANASQSVASAAEAGNSAVVPELGEPTSSGEAVNPASVPESSTVAGSGLQPDGSSQGVGGGRDDSVVPGTPKLGGQPAKAGPTFTFGGQSESSLAVSSSSTSQEASIDRTAVDFSQFAPSGEQQQQQQQQSSSATPTASGVAEVNLETSSSAPPAPAGSAIPVLGQPIEVVTSTGGPSSSSEGPRSSAGRGMRLSRTPIVWGSSADAPSAATPSASAPAPRGRGPRGRRSRPSRLGSNAGGRGGS